MKTALMVAEKPSLAQSLAKILSNGTASSRKGMNGACSIHEYTGKFQGETVLFKFTSVCGHVMTLDFHSQYNNWDKVDPAELFKAGVEKREATAKLKMPIFLEKEAKNCSYLILWLDCDKEGENICFEVIDCVKHVLSQFKIFRARFSSITETDIKHAFNNLSLPNENEALSVDARQELDLRIGCAFTRFQTKFFQGKYGNLDSSLISFGPCQTPTLGFCVERHDKIQSFKPDPYWILKTEILIEEHKFLLDWNRVRLFDREIMQLFFNEIKNETCAIIKNISKKQKLKARPIALSTVELLRIGSSFLGFGPQYTMQIAEKLYTQGYISYPRTETTKYPDNFDLRSTLRQQISNKEWGDYAKQLLENGINRPKSGQDVGDHPPITPMKCASEENFDRDSWRLYEYISKHFIATIDSDCKYMQTTIFLKIGDEEFTMIGNEMINPGYTGILSWQMQADTILPILNINDKLQIVDMKIEERFTSPPDYLSESELISLMEKHAIGTDASISVHINNICERNYVTIENGRRLKPTDLGVVLVHGYQKIDIDLVKPTMRSAIEKQLNLIAAGKADYQQILEWTLEIFEKKFQYFVKNIDGMDELFEVTFSPLANTGKPLSRCGKCKRFMKLITAKPTRLHCANCNETFSVPQNGNIKLYKELKCPLDDFELVLWTTGGKGKSYVVCPYCLNNPPFPDMKKGMGCNECTHPSCQHALEQNGISNCVECNNGTLVLDKTSAPKWRLCCNQCNVVINLFENAHKILLTDETCTDCQSTILKIELNYKTPLQNGETSHTGCIFCDEVLTPFVEMKRAQAFRHKRGRSGRGGGGRRRGRGRGSKKPKDKMSQLANYFV